MDKACERAVTRASSAFAAGNYRSAVEDLLPFAFLPQGALSPPQERDVVGCMSACYRRLLDFKTALPYALRDLELIRVLENPRSLQYAHGLKGLCMVHLGLKEFPSARAAIAEALAIMVGLGFQRREEYGGMLLELGRLERDQGCYREALANYDKAMVVLMQFKDGNEYGALVSHKGICHEELQQWSEALALKKEAVEHSQKLYGSVHPMYAAATTNLGLLHLKLKQYEQAIPLLGQALTIRQRVFGDHHRRTVEASALLEEAYQARAARVELANAALAQADLALLASDPQLLEVTLQGSAVRLLRLIVDADDVTAMEGVLRYGGTAVNAVVDENLQVVAFAFAQKRRGLLGSIQFLQLGLRQLGPAHLLRLAAEADDAALMKAVATLEGLDVNVLVEGNQQVVEFALTHRYLNAVGSAVVLALGVCQLGAARLLQLMVDADDASLTDAVASCSGVDLGALVDGRRGALDYAIATRRINAAGVLLRLRFLKTLRLLIVGNEGAGKTRLRKELQGLPYNQGSTQYLEIDTQWQVGDLQVGVWDFAGHSGYYTAQQLFLGEMHPDQLVVALCVDVRRGRGDELRTIMREWLGGMFAPQQQSAAKLALIVIATHCDELKDPHSAVKSMAEEVAAILNSHALTRRVLLMGDGACSVWLRKKDDPAFLQRLRDRLAEQGLGRGSRLLHEEVHKTLAIVRSNQIREGVMLLSALGKPSASLQRNLALLCASGLVFWSPGASSVCSDLTAPLTVFKALLRHQYARCDAVDCVDVGKLGCPTVKLFVEHNELWEVGADQSRFALGGACVSPPVAELLQTRDGQPVVFTITPRAGKLLKLRLNATGVGKQFALCVQRNCLHQPAYSYTIGAAVVADELARLYPYDPAAQQLLLSLLLSNGVLVRYRLRPLLICPGQPVLDGQGRVLTTQDYLMPPLFGSSSNLGELHWSDFGVRHARRYAIADQTASQRRLQGAVLALAAALGDGAERDHFWCDPKSSSLSVGVWHSSAAHASYVDCRYQAGRWSVYVLLGAVDRGLEAMISRAHNAMQQWIQDELNSSSVSFDVAKMSNRVAPEHVDTSAQSEWDMLHTSKVEPKVAPLLLPETMQGTWSHIDMGV
jgi:tetratricopeptide (TPR) repeat protein